MSLLCEITELMAARPHPATPPDVVADWYTRKAQLLDAIAAHHHTGPDQAADAAECAAQARAHAARLRAPDPDAVFELFTRGLPRPALLVLVGPSGAGKSTFAARLTGRDHTWDTVSYDANRAALDGLVADQTATPRAVAMAHERIDRRCEWGLSTVVDGTHVRATDRRPLLDIAARHQVPAIAIVLATPLAVCLANQHRRDRRVDPAVVQRQHRDLITTLTAIGDESFADVRVTDTWGGQQR